MHQYMLRTDQLEIVPTGKDLATKVDTKLNMNQLWALVAKKANSTMGCIRRNVASRLRETILPHLCFALARHIWSAGPSSGSPVQDR